VVVLPLRVRREGIGATGQVWGSGGLDLYCRASTYCWRISEELGLLPYR